MYGLLISPFGLAVVWPASFFATPSVLHLEVYQVLRRVRSRVAKVFPKIGTAPYYQSASAVNDVIDEWLDYGVPAESPFFLFFHYMDTHDPYFSDESPPGGYAVMHLDLQPDDLERGG